MSDPMPLKSHNFIVRLDGLHLDAAAQKRIAGAIQAATLAELGRLDLGGGKPAGALSYIPIQWLGYWYREVANLQGGVGDFGKTLGVTER